MSNLQNVNLGLAFERVVEKYSSQLAIKFDDELHCSYANLNSKANQMARYFMTIGLKKYDVVALSGLKCPDVFICIVACLKLGLIYSVFDNNSPIDRLIKIFDKCKPKAIFSDFRLLTELKKNYFQRSWL